MGVPKWYINTDSGKKIKINIEYLPLSIAKKLKEVEPVAEADIPEVLKEVFAEPVKIPIQETVKRKRR